MNCTARVPTDTFTFQGQKQFVFDIIDRFARVQSLVDYSPKGPPLTLQEHIEEEDGALEISVLRDQVNAGTVENSKLTGNHYTVEYFNGILILVDLFTDAPTNVIEASDGF